MRQPIAIALLVGAFLIAPQFLTAQTIEPGIGVVTANCTLSVAYTPGTFAPISLNTSGTICVPSFGPGPLICDSACGVLITDGGDTVLINTSP